MYKGKCKMLDRNTDSYLTNMRSTAGINEIQQLINNNQHLLNTLLLNEISKHHYRISAVEQQNQEIKIQDLENAESIDWLVRKVRELEYRFSRKEDLEHLQNPYSPNGDANCNS